MKVERKIFKGIEYVLVAELPQTQREQLLQTLSKDHFIKILIEGTVVSQCLQYKDYCLWFDNVFKSKSQPVNEVVADKVSLSATRLALNKV
jgi:hypothetical protein